MTGEDARVGPADVTARQFAIGLRGYDRVEVDEFLVRVAEAWRASLAAAPGRGSGAVLPDPVRSEVERDRATAFAERRAAERDRAHARTERAQAQEEALAVVDEAQRRAEDVLHGARDRAAAEVDAVLDEARTRLTPLLEREAAIRARLARLQQALIDVAALTGDPPTSSPVLPDAGEIVTAVEDDPATRPATFPVGFGSVTLGP